ncbi:hypothetical protein MKEN_01312200 [Mycena kentingensis (nom. inval.)]|nr:hypothetical protein MKEN_01312200 [Mycena kentingensis (nom. inval.)]
MVDDRYVGLLLAVAASTAIGTSTVITKMGLNSAADKRGRPAGSVGLAYLANPIWWGGTLTLAVGEAANFAAYSLAPPLLVTPLGALSVIIGAILASFILNEKLGHLGRIGCGLCVLGTTIIVLHAPADQDISSIPQFFAYALEPGFLLYVVTALCFTLTMMFYAGPRYGRTNPLVYISIASVVGGISVMGIKAFGVAVKLTLEGNNQFVYISTYLFFVTGFGCIVVQLYYANMALDIFSVNLVNPLYYVGFCTATIVSSLILFKGFNTASSADTASLLVGFLVTFLGVHILNVALLDGAAEGRDDAGREYARVGDEEGYVRTPLFAVEEEEGEYEFGAGAGREGTRMQRMGGSVRDEMRISPRPV